MVQMTKPEATMKEAAAILGLSQHQLRRFEKRTGICAPRTQGRQRRYPGELLTTIAMPTGRTTSEVAA